MHRIANWKTEEKNWIIITMEQRKIRTKDMSRILFLEERSRLQCPLSISSYFEGHQDGAVRFSFFL